MYQTEKELKKIYKELKEIFGEKQTDKVYSHINSLTRALEDKEKSRNKWKERCLKAKAKLK